jgi:hypothetical protein
MVSERSGQGTHQRGLARAVGAEHRDGGAVRDREGDVLQCELRLAVVHGQSADFEHDRVTPRRTGENDVRATVVRKVVTSWTSLGKAGSPA